MTGGCGYEGDCVRDNVLRVCVVFICSPSVSYFTILCLVRDSALLDRGIPDQDRGWHASRALV